MIHVWFCVGKYKTAEVMSELTGLAQSQLHSNNGGLEACRL
jgi:hypothetical protein